MRDAAESMVSQVETQTPEDMAKKFVRRFISKTPPHMQAWKVGTTKTTTQTTITQDEVATVKKSLRDSRVDFQATAKVQKVHPSTRLRGRHSAGCLLMFWDFGSLFVPQLRC